MFFLVSFYSLLGGVAIVLDLLHRQWVAAFCVAILSAAAYWSGIELKTALPRRPLKLVVAAVLFLVSLYLSHYPLHVFVAVIPGLTWAVIGLVVGFLAEPVSRRA